MSAMVTCAGGDFCNPNTSTRNLCLIECLCAVSTPRLNATIQHLKHVRGRHYSTWWWVTCRSCSRISTTQIEPRPNRTPKYKQQISNAHLASLKKAMSGLRLIHDLSLKRAGTQALVHTADQPDRNKDENPSPPCTRNRRSPAAPS